MMRNSATMTLYKPITIVPVGDVHTGSTRVPTSQIIRCLKFVYWRNLPSKEVDILVLNGDFFDRLLSYGSQDTLEIMAYQQSLLTIAREQDTTIVIVDGTKSHDWDQMKSFLALNNGEDGIGARVKFFDKVEIDFDEKYGLYTLYIPDLKVDADEIWKRVQAELARHNIDQVDYAFVHGAFIHQLPPAARNSSQAHHSHDAERYSQIVKYYILANHVHTPTSYLKVEGGGSLDRLAHGEEHDKGYNMVTHLGDKAKIEFIKNPYSTIFKTLDVTGAATIDILQKVEDIVTSNVYNVPVNIRLVSDKMDEATQILKKLGNLFPHVKVTLDHRKKVKGSDTSSPISIEEISQKIVITPQNLADKLIERAVARAPNRRNRFESLLDQVIPRSKT